MCFMPTGTWDGWRLLRYGEETAFADGLGPVVPEVQTPTRWARSRWQAVLGLLWPECV